MSSKPQATTSSEVQQEVQFGELVLRFTSTYNLRYRDRGSNAYSNGAFWQPVPPDGFYALGGIGLSYYDDPNGKVATLCVKPSSPTISGTQKPALMRPLDYDFIWNDSGSGAEMDGSCWRPKPPQGYVALGDVFATGSTNKPSLDDVMCVAKELTHEGFFEEKIWSDEHSRADRDFSSWQIQPTKSFVDSDKALISVNSFVGVEGHTRPSGSVVANTLFLPVPVVEAGDPLVPELHSKIQPPLFTEGEVDRIVTVPFTAVADDKTIEWKLANSPFYTIERSVYYERLLFEDNKTEVPQTISKSVTTGVTKTDSETNSITTGLKVSYESGVSAGGFSSKMTVELSLQLGYSTTKSISVMQSEQQNATLVIPPGTAAALWLLTNELTVRRADGTAVAPGLKFNTANTGYISRQYPLPGDGVQLARYRRSRIKLG